jgi:predicted O-methyltransferase YrrM
VTDPFGEQWYGPSSCKTVQALVAQTKGLSGRVVEVGCWTGRSTVHIARGCYPDPVHAVDTWEGSPGEISADLARERDVFVQFTENVADFTRGNVEVHRQGWRDYFAEDKGPIRFLHIDAEHTYREVFDNIATVLPLMVAGGIVCGDDVHHPPIVQAVTEHFGTDWRREASLWIHEVG